MPKKVEARNGGFLLARLPGEKPSSKSGRPKNPFREYIKELADDSGPVILDGELLDEFGKLSGHRVRVAVAIPGALEVVRKMYLRAAKHGDVQAAKWLVESAFGKSVKLGDDEENPLFGGFAVILPSNSR